MLMLAGKKISQSTLACSVVKVPKRRGAAPGCERRGVAPDARTTLPRGAVHAAGARLEACVRMCVRVRTTSCPRYSATPSPQWREWWSRGDSNPLPPPCKGGALPGELRPLRSPLGEPGSAQCGEPRPSDRSEGQMVGHPGLEPGTSVLSGLRSNHLS